MLSPKMLATLNDQIKHEFFSSNIYLAMSSWCSAKGLRGSARFLEHHADEEMVHMRKIFNYINETDAQAVVPALEQPPTVPIQTTHHDRSCVHVETDERKLTHAAPPRKCGSATTQCGGNPRQLTWRGAAPLHTVYPCRSARPDAPVDTSRMRPLPRSHVALATRKPSRDRPARSTNAPNAHPYRDRPLASVDRPCAGGAR